MASLIITPFLPLWFSRKPGPYGVLYSLAASGQRWRPWSSRTSTALWQKKMCASFPTFRCFFATDLVTRPRMVDKRSYSICTVFNQDMIRMVSVLHQLHHDI